ncbi:Choline/ethanolamine kinase [Oesophagostomum dentatum]|uniref:ethanolamine kinase n=1 Tax=Oesophagostomum dentatum TaxID=61180 RepID=A0A0B1SNF8_OESDE|nr:Choline/ethanolamine kinase [Oesophagostomum dentatum]
MQKRICATMAAYHNMDTPEIEFDKLFPFRKTRDFIRNMDMSAAQNSLSFISHLEENLRDIQALIRPLNEEIAFCHNDLLAHNVIFDESSGRVLFIDYEYADFNYALFDIGNHFCEFAGVEEPDYSKCPNKEEIRSFLRIYLEARQGNVDEDRLETMLRRVPLFQAFSHLLWSAWAVVQSQNSTLDFDYASYAAIRYEQYKKCLDSYCSDLRN